MHNENLLDCNVIKKRLKEICKKNKDSCKIYKNMLDKCYQYNMNIYYKTDVKYVIT